MATRYGPPFKLFRLPDSVVERRNILIKSMGIGTTVTKNDMQPSKAIILPQIILIIRSDNSKSFIQFNVLASLSNHSYAICISLYVNRIRLYLLLCHQCVIRMSLVRTRISSNMSLVYTRMSLLYTYMSFVCHSYVLVYHPVCHSYVIVSHSYVLACHPHVTRMYSFLIRMSVVCTRCHPDVTRM